ncbi:MAG: carboxypeptidase regulatory-like domain-containing protein [Planctomycetes bacterium]|nr:carboxypeptidase regulatory-like domain-containing protein [Planctomycetota bacterium]
MNRNTSLTIIALLLACIAAIVFYPADGMDADVDPAAIVDLGLVDAEYIEESPTAKVELSGRAMDGARSSNYPHWTTPPDRDHDLHGIVLGPDERPISGAAVFVTRPTRQGVSTLDLVRNKSTQAIGSTISNEDGEFRIHLKQGSLYDLEVSAEGLHSPMMKGCQAGEYVIIRLEPSSSLEGILTSAKTGEAQMGVRVRMFRSGGKGRRHETDSDENGHYIFSGLTKGHWYLAVTPPKLKPPDWGDIEVVAGERIVRDFALEEGASVKGRVVDAVSGSPIANAEISDSWVFRRTSYSDADGNFELTGLESEQDHIELHARAAGFGVKAFGEDEVNSGTEIVLALLPAKTVIGKIVLEDGTPVSGVYVAAAGCDFSGSDQQIDWPSTTSGDDGKFEIKNVRPDIPHTLQVIKADHGSLLFEFPPNEHELTHIDLGEIILPDAAWIAGRCHNEAGDGIAGVKLKLTGWNKDRERFGRAADGDLGIYLGDFELTSDDLGRFRFPDLAAGSYVLSAKRGGIKQGNPKVFELVSGQGHDGIAVLISDGEIIEGKVLGPDNLPFVDAQVELRKGTGRSGDRVRASTDENGHFEFRSVPPGSYSIHAWPPYSMPPLANNEIILATKFADVVPGQQGLVLNLGRGQAITGQVFDASGNPVNRAWVKAFDLAGVEVESTNTNLKGEFTLRLLAGALVDVEASQRYISNQQGDDGEHWIPNPDPPSVTQAGVAAGTSGLTLVLP